MSEWTRSDNAPNFPRKAFSCDDAQGYLSARKRITMVRIIVRAVNNLPINFGVSMTFRSRLIDKHLSDASRDLATLTFDLLTSK